MASTALKNLDGLFLRSRSSIFAGDLIRSIPIFLFIAECSVSEVGCAWGNANNMRSSNLQGYARRPG